MRETGLEPARYLLPPGPQPGASANSAIPAVFDEAERPTSLTMNCQVVFWPVKSVWPDDVITQIPDGTKPVSLSPVKIAAVHTRSPTGIQR